jgi:hypothetical protein
VTVTPTPTVTVAAEPTPTVTVTVGPTVYPIRNGDYGGTNVKVSVHSTHVDFTFACATGEISHTVLTDSLGSFDERGTYTAKSGPVPPGGFPARHAVYYGFVHGDEIHFDVAYRDDNDDNIDIHYDATFGEDPNYTVLCALNEPQPQASPMIPMPNPSSTGPYPRGR